MPDITYSVPPIELSNAAVRYRIYLDGELQGTLFLRKGKVTYKIKGVGKKNERHMAWKQLTDYIYTKGKSK